MDLKNLGTGDEGQWTRDKGEGIRNLSVSSILLFSFFIFSFFISQAQTFNPNRLTAWENAGPQVQIQAPTNQANIMDFGADNTGVNNCSEAYAAALISLNGSAGTIFFPDGDYLFTSSISVTDSLFLKGESTASKLLFNNGGSGNLIQLNGSIASTQYAFAATAIKGTHQIDLSDASAFQVGDVVRLYQFDEDLMFSSWAYGTLGQVMQIVAVNGNTLSFSDPLNHHYPLSRTPYLKKMNPVTAAGLECLSIERLDATVTQTSNIYVNAAFNCVVRNVQSENCNFGHLEMNSSAHVLVEGCYFHHAFAYGGGGQGYGVVSQVASSFNLVQNNVFEHLRHSMLLQSGANGNVYAYNYSTDPFWTEGGIFPANSAGDLVFHGNYTYMNLAEGNTVQHIVIDASHGKNGPYNTFFRNRAELYGFFSDGSTTSDSMNVVGNELTQSTFPYGMYNLQGLGHYAFGNNLNGTTSPVGTSNVTQTTLFLDENDLPYYLAGQTLPMVGYPLFINQKLLPAKARFANQEPVECADELVTSVSEMKKSGTTVSMEGMLLSDLHLPLSLAYHGLDGRLLSTETIRSLPYWLAPSRHFRVLRITDAKGQIAVIKLFPR